MRDRRNRRDLSGGSRRGLTDLAGARIHVLGAAGSGTSTLAHALADRLSSQVFDTDDFYWVPTDPPFQRKRPVSDRIRLMEEVFLPRSDWVLSGSMVGWSGPVEPRLTHVIFLSVTSAVRLARLRARERRRHGALIAPGGPLWEAHRGFLDWAMNYEEPSFTGRSRRLHEAWLASLSVPVQRLDGTRPVQDLVADVVAALDQGAPAT